MLAAAVSVSVVLTFLAAPFTRAQRGSDCSEGRQCSVDQECVVGYCRCREGFVQREKDCFPERAFNETCEFEGQCVDFRLKCDEGRCVCVKYYQWDANSGKCLMYKDLQYILNDMEEKYHSSGRLLAETNLVFTGLLWTGLAVMVIGLSLASGCLFYGCCYGRLCCCPQDKLARSNRSFRSRPIYSGQTQRTTETTAPGSVTNSGLVNSPVSQGAGIDYIPSLYETTSFDV